MGLCTTCCWLAADGRICDCLQVKPTGSQESVAVSADLTLIKVRGPGSGCQAVLLQACHYTMVAETS